MWTWFGFLNFELLENWYNELITNELLTNLIPKIKVNPDYYDAAVMSKSNSHLVLYQLYNLSTTYLISVTWRAFISRTSSNSLLQIIIVGLRRSNNFSRETISRSAAKTCNYKVKILWIVDKNITNWILIYVQNWY